MNDTIRAAIMAVATSLVPTLVLLKVIDLDETQVAGVNLFITNVVIMAALLYKGGQQPSQDLADKIVTKALARHDARQRAKPPERDDLLSPFAHTGGNAAPPPVRTTTPRRKPRAK